MGVDRVDMKEREERRRLMAEPVLLWGSRYEERQDAEIDILVRYTAGWDLRILRPAMRRLMGTWAYGRVPGPNTVHEHCRSIVGKLREWERRTKQAAQRHAETLERAEAERMLEDLESQRLAHKGFLGPEIDVIMRGVLSERLG